MATILPFRPPSLEELQHQVDEFNLKYPVGTNVKYWPGTRHSVPKLGKTWTDARVMGGHTPVVYVEGAGAIALSHVEPITRPQTEK